MAERNKVKLTPFEMERNETAKKVLEYKVPNEANVVTSLYMEPERIHDYELSIKDFHNNMWKVYFQIVSDIVIKEKKNVIDDITVGLYLEQHPKLKEKYTEYGGYNIISSTSEYIKLENFDGYVSNLKKWGVVLKLCKEGFPVKTRLSDYADMCAEDIYNEFEIFLNNTFMNTDSEIKAYNIFDEMIDFIEELDKGSEIGIPLYGAKLVTNEIGGFNCNGNIYGLGGNSGAGKSTMAFNYLIPSAIKFNEQVVFIINEEDEKKFKKEMIIWVANNVYKEKLQKYELRNGHFSDELKAKLIKYSKWIEDKKEKKIFRVVPLQHYSVNIAIKIIKKYSSAGVRMFVLDTLKESFDAMTDEIYKSMMRDMIKLYDVVKPSARNVGLFVTYQLGKGSLKVRHLTNNDIGQAKSIVDVMSVNIMMRRPFDDEFKNEKNELHCWNPIGENGKSKEMFYLEEKEKYMITFITKNRFGETDTKQIVSKCDLSTNLCEDIGYCNVRQDW